VGASNNPDTLLAEANRLAWVFNWPKAEPLYVRAEELFKQRGDTRNEIYARVGRIRAQAEASSSWVEVSEMLAQQLEFSVAKTDQRLRLWCLAAKGYTDLEINPRSAKRAWTEARKIAHTLKEPEWEARAGGELGVITFLEGDSRRAGTMVGDAFLSAMASGDVGAQIRYLELLGQGFTEGKRYAEGMAFFNRAIKIANATPDVGFPFMAFEGKAECLVAQCKPDEPRSVLEQALPVARKNGKLGYETMILFRLGELELRAGNRQKGLELLEQAGATGQTHNFYRLVGQIMFVLASSYRDAGDLKSAEEMGNPNANVSL
jgi:tetratricopeptide (TPR) repeat protein